MPTQITGTAITVGSIDLTTPLAVVDGGTGVSTDPYRMVTMTAQNSTSGTSIDFTSIPSWVKRITVMFNGVSTNGTSAIQIQLGDSGGIETSGYLGASTAAGTAVLTSNYTTGVGLNFGSGNVATSIRHGSIIFTNLTGNTWICFGVLSLSDTAATSTTSSSKLLSDVLTQVRITTVNGTDTFDAGSINVMYEG